jgi:hypothetical protein
MSKFRKLSALVEELHGRIAALPSDLMESHAVLEALNASLEESRDQMQHFVFRASENDEEKRMYGPKMTQKV